MKSGNPRRPTAASTFARLEKHIAELDRIGQGNCSSREFVLWRRQTEASLKALYGEESTEVQDFNAIYYAPVFLTCRMGDEAFEEAYRNGLEEARRLLQVCMETLRQHDEPRSCERIPRG